MKYIVLLASILFNIQILNAQITKGHFMMGGDVSYKIEEERAEQKFKVLRVNPNIGYFIFDKMAVGVQANAIRSVLKISNTKQKNTLFNVGVFTRYYLLKEDNFFNLIGEAGYLYGESYSESAVKKLKSNTISFTGGPVLFLNPSVALEFLTSYSMLKYNGSKGTNNTLEFSIGLQVHLEKREN